MIFLPTSVYAALFSHRPDLYSLFFYKMHYMEAEIHDRASFQKFLKRDTFSPHVQAGCF